ncbi:hypothetical protein F4778DRAFT_244120 [Xylariomycetidae sp. FL2044]|nr:hypothetical protein F4778DRAFT_244120 [Xylariomycetidae sp. FL2044]
MYARAFTARAVARPLALSPQVIAPRFFSSTSPFRASKIVIMGLPYSVDKYGLDQKFNSFGTVIDAYLVTDKNTGRSKGFGFIEFDEDDAAAKAIEAVNDTDFDGRNVTVAMAREREPARGQYGSGGFENGPRRGNGSGYGQGQRGRTTGYSGGGGGGYHRGGGGNRGSYEGNGEGSSF